MEYKIDSLPLWPEQYKIANEIVNSDAIYHTIVGYRGFGKSVIATQLMLWFALNKPNQYIIYVTDFFSQSALARRMFKAASLKNPDIFLKAGTTVEFCNGSIIDFRTFQYPEALRSGHPNYLFCDEAAQFSDEDFELVLLPLLNPPDKNKKLILISSPKGKNYFYNYYLWGQDPEMKEYRSYLADINKDPQWTKEKLSALERVMNPIFYKQEYLGEFLDSGGSVFNIEKNQLITSWKQPDPGERYYAGVDLGQQVNYTSIVIINQKYEVCFIERFRQMEMLKIKDEIVKILKRWNPKKTLIEITGNFATFYELVKKEFPNVNHFDTSGPSKTQIVEELQLSLEEGLKLPTKEFLPQLTRELVDFTFDYNLKNRSVRYYIKGNRDGSHGDIAMSLMFANHARRNFGTTGSYSVTRI